MTNLTLTKERTSSTARPRTESKSETPDSSRLPPTSVDLGRSAFHIDSLPLHLIKNRPDAPSKHHLGMKMAPGAVPAEAVFTVRTPDRTRLVNVLAGELMVWSYRDVTYIVVPETAGTAVVWPATVGQANEVAYHFSLATPISRTIAEHLSWEGVTASLNQLAQLVPDWDSYGAYPISAKAIARARRLVTSLYDKLAPILGNRSLPSDITPVADGSVHLRWEAENRELVIKIARDGTLGFFLVDRSGGQRRTLSDAGVSETEVTRQVASVFPA
jgi:hypothetical protein